MIIRSPEPEVKILVDRDPIKTSFEEWARPGHFSRTIAKGPDTTTWIWNLHADAHDFDSHTSDLEEISRKVFSAHFGQLSIIFVWLSGMYFHGARFSNYEAWLSDPTHIGPSAQVVWPIVGQEILNGDVGGGFRGIQITSGFFQIWRASGITSELQLYCTAIGALIFAALMLFAGWFHYHKAAPKLAWFQDVESMLNHHLAGLLGLGSLSWAGHQVHVSLPINQFLNAGVDPKEIPLPHEFILNRDLLAQLYPSFAEGATPFFTLNWSKYAEFLTFRGGLDPVTGGLWLTDIAHHHLAIAILFLIAGHMYRTNWGIGHGLKDILEAHKGPFTGQGHKGLYEILTTSWHAQLSLNLAMLGSLTIVVAHHMYSMPPYPYLATDYGVLFARSSRLIPDKANLGFRFPCDGPGRGGTCQSDVWGSISDQGIVTHITGGNFAQSSITINGWLRDFLWAQASQVIQSYGSSLSAYGLFFLGAHFVWAFSLMFLFSGRGYWQELIESIVWAHNKLKVAPATQPRALSIVQGRAVGVTHYLLGGIATTWAFFLARIIAVG
ncbi:Photosystem I P700 chlorophyll a apoprotein A1 [Camellia lanceoleosa]|nr:Photosystem I P700 chlorophyll a apoprotein A1 [Camellia lanceoleosa]